MADEDEQPKGKAPAPPRGPSDLRINTRPDGQPNAFGGASNVTDAQAAYDKAMEEHTATILKNAQKPTNDLTPEEVALREKITAEVNSNPMMVGNPSAANLIEQKFNSTRAGMVLQSFDTDKDHKLSVSELKDGLKNTEQFEKVTKLLDVFVDNLAGNKISPTELALALEGVKKYSDQEFSVEKSEMGSLLSVLNAKLPNQPDPQSKDGSEPPPRP